MSKETEQRDSAEQQSPPETPVAPTAPANSIEDGAAFKDVDLALTAKEWSASGTNKLLFEMLQASKRDCKTYISFQARYYEADKQCGILRAEKKVNVANEVLSSVGIGIGGIIVGLGPSLHDPKNYNGLICIGIGFALVIGGIVGRILK